MEKIILHRNYGSPYCQKIMAMLGFVQLDWYSEITTKGIPRPVQETLTGSYSRRVPILQMGSDMYCDTKEISHQIANLTGVLNLSYYHLSKDQQQYADELESELGMSVIGLLNPLEMIISYFKHIPIKDAYEFIVDRIKIKKSISGKSPFEEKTKEEWEVILMRSLTKMNVLLEDHMFLSGDTTPNYIDFTAYTHIWYSNRLNKLKYAKDMPNIKKWLIVMDKFDIGNCKELDEGEVLDIARNTEPKTITSTYLQTTELNQPISVQVNDSLAFIMDPVQGVLVGANKNKYILKREDANIGYVHIHIPTQCHGACG